MGAWTAVSAEFLRAIIPSNSNSLCGKPNNAGT
jgi:hypothetical protein